MSDAPPFGDRPRVPPSLLKSQEEARSPGTAPGVRLSWVEYLREFGRRHGGWCLVVRGRLCWGDGWTYSATDVRGPEWPPPDDPQELAGWLVPYWRERLALTRSLLARERAGLARIEGEAAGRDGPLVAVSVVRDESGAWRRVVGPPDLPALRRRVDDLAEQERAAVRSLAEAEEMLACGTATATASAATDASTPTTP